MSINTAEVVAPAAVGRSIEELPDLFGGVIRLARAGLGITAFGVQVMDLPPDYTTDAHDEADTGQQELYVALRGDGAVVAGGTVLALDPGRLVRVDAGVSRVLRSGAAGLRVLCVGAVPGAAYVAPEWTAGG
jgi:uncharacterized cupin superfamily protein